MGSTPHPLPAEPLRDVRSVKTAVLGGDKGVDGERSPARASSPGPNPRTGHRRGGPSREGTRSRLLHCWFAPRWGKRGLGRSERLRGPLPVLVGKANALPWRRTTTKGARANRCVGGGCDAQPPRYIDDPAAPPLCGVWCPARRTVIGRKTGGCASTGIGIRGCVRGS
jgi:hypothetical protein